MTVPIRPTHSQLPVVKGVLFSPTVDGTAQTAAAPWEKEIFLLSSTVAPPRRAAVAFSRHRAGAMRNSGKTWEGSKGGTVSDSVVKTLRATVFRHNRHGLVAQIRLWRPRLVLFWTVSRYCMNPAEDLLSKLSSILSECQQGTVMQVTVWSLHVLRYGGMVNGRHFWELGKYSPCWKFRSYRVIKPFRPQHRYR